MPFNAFISTSTLILTGRLISLLYGGLTVLLIYFITKELFSDLKTALMAAGLLSLAGLHVTHSHYATVDAGNPALVLYVYKLAQAVAVSSG